MIWYACNQLPGPARQKGDGATGRKPMAEPDGEYAEYVAARLPRLHRTAYLMCGDPHRADDLVQATLVSLYVHWRRARTADNLDGYVHRIMSRRFVDERRLGWSRVLLRPEPPDLLTTVDADLDEREQIVAALRRLPRGQRAVIVLRYFEDLSVEDTAAALGCSTGNVKSQCARGLTTLRGLLSGHGSKTSGGTSAR
jgi:RNA polymerase sigma-70 factor (sigma-E family)